MPVQNNSDSAVSPTVDDSQSPKIGAVGGATGKELEPENQEEKVISEIRAVEAADEQAEREVQAAISDARLSRPEPKIPAEVTDSGVKVPQLEANAVIVGGTTLELPITEEEYKRGLHQKVAGMVVNSVIIGASSLVGLALWAGRIIKMAHQHAMKVVFRKSSFKKTSEGKEGNKDAN